MAVSRALRRLLRIRDLEEEQARLALEAALGDRHRLEQALEATVGRERGGRRMVQDSARSGELPDRLAGLEESRTAERLAAVLTPRLAAADEEVLGLREDYLDARVERRQAETLIEEAEAAAALDGERRSQQGLDDWFRNRMHRAAQQAGRSAVPVPPGKTEGEGPGRREGASSGSEKS
jgi:flagellar biosynthesis chaperone FliJ